MAKISTYTTVAPQLGDMLIGTDVNDMNMTKNFTVGDILDLGASSSLLVPYNGANDNVDLGAYTITTSGFVLAGGSSSEFLKADGSIDSNAYLTTASAAADYVPYTGANANVDLDTYKLTSASLDITTDDATMVGIQCPATNYFLIGDNGWTMSALHLNFANQVYYLGDWEGAASGTYIAADDDNQRVEVSKALYVSGSTGTTGQILTSQGSGTAPHWVTPTFLAPIYGSFYDTTTQSVTSGQVKAIELNTTDATCTNGFSIVNNTLGRPTRITATVTGIYNLAFSAQLSKSGGGSPAQVDIWIRINGTDIPYSNTGIVMRSNGDKVVAAWNFFLPLTAGQYVELMWTQGDLIDILAEVAGVNYPATPSVIATINRVS